MLTHCTMRFPMSIDILEIHKCKKSFHAHFLVKIPEIIDFQFQSMANKLGGKYFGTFAKIWQKFWKIKESHKKISTNVVSKRVTARVTE